MALSNEVTLILFKSVHCVVEILLLVEANNTNFSTCDISLAGFDFDFATTFNCTSQAFVQAVYVN